MDKNKQAEAYANRLYKGANDRDLGAQETVKDYKIAAATHFLAGYDAAESIANAKIQELEEQLKKAEEVLRSMHIDTMAWNIQHTEPEILAGWHESNNEKIEQYLKSRGE